eukprot:TRINITY_DN2390_c0_g1_i1.p1 TRINITY_DN2390_c0_g1~~TRINITY_DN2390_c0_g1_i1.p1  ORF type:complete len:359 (-),score=38.74 TRINITY_DN2390_c0_g1_i1:76-1116(-)
MAFVGEVDNLSLEITGKKITTKNCFAWKTYYILDCLKSTSYKNQMSDRLKEAISQGYSHKNEWDLPYLDFSLTSEIRNVLNDAANLRIPFFIPIGTNDLIGGMRNNFIECTWDNMKMLGTDEALIARLVSTNAKVMVFNNGWYRDYLQGAPRSGYLECSCGMVYTPALMFNGRLNGDYETSKDCCTCMCSMSVVLAIVATLLCCFVGSVYYVTLLRDFMFGIIMEGSAATLCVCLFIGLCSKYRKSIVISCIVAECVAGVLLYNIMFQPNMGLENQDWNVYPNITKDLYKITFDCCGIEDSQCTEDSQGCFTSIVPMFLMYVFIGVMVTTFLVMCCKKGKSSYRRI